jgi:6-phosphogluconolactonase
MYTSVEGRTTQQANAQAGRLDAHAVRGRRAVLSGMMAATGALARPAASFAQPSAAPKPAGAFGRFAYVGCRTSKERSAHGEGIQVYRIDAASGTWTHVQLVSDLVNPSFLAFDRTQQFLYAVHGDMSDVSAFSIDAHDGTLTFLERQSTQGKNPVHLTPDEANRFIILANYATGTVAVLPRKDDGRLDAVRQLEPLPGNPGPNKVEQTSSQPHEVAWDRRRQFLIVPDKGLDRIFTFRFDSAQGKLIAGDPAFVQVRPGAGPRHVVFHPTAPFAFVAHELDSSVGAYRYDADGGALTPLQVVPSVPDTSTGANTAAEIDITPSGRFVFVSNRGHDSIGTFRVDASSGRLVPVEWTSSEGRGPRFIALDPSGTLLHAANENSDTIVPFRVDADTGQLSRAGDVTQTGSPVCIVFSTI